MKQIFAAITICLTVLACSYIEERPASNMAAARATKKERADLRAAIKKLEPFFKPMGEPQANDWLRSNFEPGQTFEEYLDSKPKRPTKTRQTLYVLPLGKFTPQQKKVIDLAAGYIEAFYDLPVREMYPLELKLPTDTKDLRKNQYKRAVQVRTGYILDEILLPILPEDGAALIAFTDQDLFPNESMSYVFGQASLENRVGVWSLARLDANADRNIFLRRTLKIAAHETGHMFSMLHCKKYECLMSGTNHLAETDRRPIDACPECTAKICWLSDIKVSERYDRLADFTRRNGLLADAKEFEAKAAATRITENP